MERKYLAILLVGLFAVSTLVTWFFLWNFVAEVRADSSGKLVFANRPAVNYTKVLLSETNDSITYKIVYASHGRNVYALLTYPKTSGPHPAFFFIPGATVKKEGAQDGLGKDLNKLGFATLTIDQWGHGETGGQIPSLDVDYSNYAAGRGSVYQEMIYDALRAFDVLYAEPDVDKNGIYAAGESMGGRPAAIGTAIEPRIKGILLLSTSGYGFTSQPDMKLAEYLNSIDPDRYVSRVSPRPLVMAHIQNDAVVSFAMAQRTFSLAGQPKTFVTIQAGEHGYDTYSAEGKQSVLDAVSGWA